MSTVIIDTNQWIRGNEAASLAGVTRGRIWQLAQEGQIEKLNVSERLCLYSKQSVLRWANRERPQTGRPRISDQ